MSKNSTRLVDMALICQPALQVKMCLSRTATRVEVSGVDCASSNNNDDAATDTTRLMTKRIAIHSRGHGSTLVDMAISIEYL